MKKVLATLVAAALLGGLVLALASLAGAEPGEGKSAKSAKIDRVLFALLKGRNEIGTDGRKGAGDPDGRGGFTATLTADQVCFGITVDNLDQPVAAHIHRAGPNVAGPIVIPLTPPSSGDPGASSGCVAADPELLTEIAKHPNRFYANVHTGPFQGGAVRGQLKHRRP